MTGIFGIARTVARWFGRWRKPRLVLGPGGYGTVYVFRQRGDAHKVKVGYTARLSKTRKAEIDSRMRLGGSLRQVFALDMSFAWTVEQQAHRRLKRHRARVGRQREWFHADRQGGIEHILSAVLDSAKEVRAEALKQGRWSEVDDRATKAWMLTEAGPVRFRPFVEDANESDRLRRA